MPCKKGGALPAGVRDERGGVRQASSRGQPCRGARCPRAPTVIASRLAPSDIGSMALARKKPTTIALEPEMDALLTRAAEKRGVSGSELNRRQLALVLEQYGRHPRPRVAGTIRHALPERGDEAEVYAGRRR